MWLYLQKPCSVLLLLLLSLYESFIPKIKGIYSVAFLMFSSFIFQWLHHSVALTL